MALATSAAIAAGAIASAAYLDAKFHVKKDLDTLRLQYGAVNEAKRAAKEDRFSLFYKFEAQAKRLPSTEQCLWSHNGCYTWQQTYDQVCRYAQFQQAAGVKPGELVAVYLQNHPEFMFSTIASWSIGSGPALINNNLSGDGLLHCLKISGAKVLIVDEDEGCRARIEEARERIENELGMRIHILDARLKGEINQLQPTRPEDKLRQNMPGTFPMCLMYTSGSTGLPKACPFYVATGNFLAGPRLKMLGLEPGPNADRWYICMPLYHGTGFTSACACMLGGVTLCIGRKFSVSRFWDDIRAADATAFVYVGETARYLLAAPPNEKDKEHRVKLMFGNGMRPDVWPRFVERFGIATVSEFFNSTEGVFGITNVCRGPYFETAVGHHGGITRFMFRNTYVPVKIDPDTETIWRDPKTGFAQRNPYEEGGEILVKMPSEAAFVGYWENPDATKKKFERDVFVKGDLYYRTGDALRRTTDGRWFFMDRLGDTFRWKSENVSTTEVAEVLGRFPGVVESIVFGVLVPGHDGRAGLAAVHVDPQARQAFDINELLKHARANLPKYAVPIFLRLTAEMVPMHNNKQNKIPLKKDGIDVEQIEASTKDQMFWCPSALLYTRGATNEEGGYVKFTKQDLERLKASATVPSPRI